MATVAVAVVETEINHGLLLVLLVAELVQSKTQQAVQAQQTPVVVAEAQLPIIQLLVMVAQAALATHELHIGLKHKIFTADKPCYNDHERSNL